MHATLPFSAFLGYTVARRALLCVLVDPTLRGVVVSGPPGTGKTALMRSFAHFVRDLVEPDAPIIEVPLGVTDDRLVGGVDLEASIVAGELRARGGLIGAAHEGFLFVDDLPLLDPAAAFTLMQALESEVVLCEREGVSTREPARFSLLATAVPAERELAPAIADRVAFLIGAEPISRDSAHLLVRRLELLERAPEDVRGHYAPLDESLARSVATASERLAGIGVSDAVRTAIVEVAESYGIMGNRAEVFAVKAARAHAALRAAAEVADQDVEFARATVLLPRALRVPQEEGDGRWDEMRGDLKEAGEDDDEGMLGEHGTRISRQYASPEGIEREGVNPDEPGEERDGSGQKEFIDEERVLQPLDFTAPLAPLAQFFVMRSGSDPGKHGLLAHWQRGRHVRSPQADPEGKRIAIAATLRAAAPHQRTRGRLDAGGRVEVRTEDLRVKRFSMRAGTLFVFCVDASGSMARNRMSEAKGAVTRLLQDAYVNRDTVALIAFRGSEAQVLLPPTGSVERAKRSLDVLPTGGGTPLASALVKAFAIVQLARRRDVTEAVVVLLTDGRANVPLSENAAAMIRDVRRRHVRAELATIGASYRRAGIRALVIDTSHTSGKRSEAARLAEVLGGQHYHLPSLDAQVLKEIVRG